MGVTRVHEGDQREVLREGQEGLLRRLGQEEHLVATGEEAGVRLLLVVCRTVVHNSLGRGGMQ